jgi:hypothetical protein
MTFFARSVRTSLMSGVAAVTIAGAGAIFLADVAFAQSGHFLTGGNNAPQCTDIGTQVECSGKVAGLGGTTFEIEVRAPGTAIVECTNPGGNVAPGQNTTVTAEGSTEPLPTPQNGRYNFTVTTDVPQVTNVPTCPNPQWTATVVDVVFTTATLSLYEDDVLSDQITVTVTVP